MTDLEIFISAPEELDGEALAAYFDEACGDDVALRERVEALHQSSNSAPDFLKQPACVEPNTEGEPGGEELEEAGSMIGNYKLLQKIGEGGFGTVYMAEQSKPVKRRVALKIIKLGMDTRQVVARFEVERQALAMMDHPNIAKVLDAGTTGSGRPFFVMELVRGIPITKFCDDQNLSTGERLELYINVCRAVQHAHQKGVIHRDLKPSNVMVTMHDDRSVPKVIDFGVAKATQQDLTDKTLYTRYEQFIGTPAYMSPEQAHMSGLDIDTRSDIYALGVLLYELLTGRTPFDAKDLQRAGQDEIRRIIREDEPSKPSTRLSTLADVELTDLAKHRKAGPDRLRSQVKGDLDWIVMKALEKDRTRRYETANALAMDVQRHLDDEPVEAAAPTTAYRLQKYVRRHRTALGAAAAIATVLLAGIVASTLFAVKATRSERQAEIANKNLEDELAENEALQKETAERERNASFRLVDPIPLSGDPGIGIANLVAYIRKNPDNHVAAERLMAALRQREFSAPIREPFEDAHWASYNADGSLIVTADFFDGIAQVRNAVTGELEGKPIKTDLLLTEALFSPNPNHTRILTTSHSADSSLHVAQVWDWMTGEKIGAPLEHAAHIQFANFSPAGDRTLTGGDGGVARIWNTETGEALHSFGFDSWVGDGEWTPDGTRIALAAGDGTAGIWDAETGERISPGIQHGSAIWSIRFDTDGRRVVTGSTDGSARVWDAESGAPIGMPMRHGGRVQYAEFSHDGKRVATASWDNTARIWDAETGDPLTDPLKQDGQVWIARFSPDPDGRQLLTAGKGGKAQLWDVWTGRPIGATMPIQGPVWNASFHPNGENRILISGRGGKANIWSPKPSQPQSQIFRHRDAWGWNQGGALVSAASFSPDGSKLVTAAGDAWVRLWDLQTGKLLHRVAHSAPNKWVTFNRDGTRFLSTSIIQGIRIWDTETGGLVSSPLVNGHAFHAEFSPDPKGKWVVGSSVAGRCGRVWDTETGSPISEPLTHDSFVNYASFSPDGLRVVTCGGDYLAKIWELPEGKLLCTLEGHQYRIATARFSPDGERVITASADKTARIWNARTGKAIGSPLAHRDAVPYAEFSPDPGGDSALTASMDKSARLWDGHSGEFLGVELRHAQGVKYACFNSSGSRVVTASSDGTGRVWDTETGLPLSEGLRHSGGVAFATFSPDGNQVVTTGDDTTARVWEMPPAPEGTIPPWVPDWAEAVAGVRITEGNNAISSDWAEWDKQWKVISKLPEQGFYNQVAHWFYEPPRQRTISPFSKMTVPQYVANRLRERSPDGLADASVADLDKSAEFGRMAMILQDLQQVPRGERSDVAVAAARADVEFLKLHLGSNDPISLLARHDLAMRLHEAEHYPEALEEWESLLGDERTILGENHRDTLNSMKQYAKSLREKPGDDEEETILKQVMSSCAQIYGPMAVETLEAQQQLGIFYREVWQNEKAEREFSAVIESRRATLGPEHPDTLESMHHKAWTLRHANRHSEALEISDRLVPLAKSVLGSSNNFTLFCMGGRAAALHGVGQLEEAIELRRKVLADRERIFGEKHSTTMQVMGYLADTLQADGRDEEALSLIQRALHLRTQVDGADAESTLEALDRLAKIQQDQGRIGEAAATREDLVARGREAGEPKPYVVWLERLARLYSDHGEHERAIAIDREALRIRDEYDGESSDLSRTILQRLSVNYNAVGQKAEAHEVTEDVLRRTIEGLAPDDPDRAKAESELAELSWEDELEKWKLDTRNSVARGDFSEARRHFAKLVLGRVIFEAHTGRAGEDAKEVDGLRAVVEQNPAAPPMSILVGTSSEWRYLDGDGEFPGPAWKDPAFDDALWKLGAGKFGYGDVQEGGTKLEPDAKEERVSYYFRHRFAVGDPAALGADRLLTIALNRDDGAVIYLNGVEIARSNMPPGEILPATQATAAVGPKYENLFHTLYADAETLREGENLIAVEVHQKHPEQRPSSDLSFDLELSFQERPSAFFDRWPGLIAEAAEAMGESPLPIAETFNRCPRGIEFFFRPEVDASDSELAPPGEDAWTARAEIQRILRR